MTITAFAATVLGIALGLRYTAWALLPCLGATVLTMAAFMLVSASSLSSMALSIIVALASMEVGYLAGAYAAQSGLRRRSPRLAFRSNR